MVSEKNNEIIDSINYAKRIQDAILPSRRSLTESLKNGFVFYRPKDLVSGDFYWLESYKGRIFFAVADCTVHGVPGAMVSVICANSLSKSLLESGITDPGDILNHSRDLIMEHLNKSGTGSINDGMDISLASIDQHFIKNEEQKVEIQWVGANNPPMGR